MTSESSMLTAYVMHLSTLLKNSAKRMYAKVGLSATEYPIITMLIREGEQNIGQICLRLDRDKSHVSRDIAALVKRGLVTKGRAAADARQIVVRLSPEAEAAREQMVAVMQERVAKLTDGLSPDDVEASRRILSQMIRNAQDMRSDF